MVYRTVDLDEAKALLEYEPSAGSLIWRLRSREHFADDRIWKSWNARYAGTPAGTDFQGYKSIKICGKYILAHRLVWAMLTGEWPKQDIDHINGDRSDNRLENLRDVSRSENLRNSAVGRHNTSGVRGVDWFSPFQRWRARIYDNGKEISLGLFKDKELAIAARKAAEAKYGYHPNHSRAATR